MAYSTMPGGARSRTKKGVRKNDGSARWFDVWTHDRGMLGELKARRPVSYSIVLRKVGIVLLLF